MKLTVKDDTYILRMSSTELSALTLLVNRVSKIDHGYPVSSMITSLETKFIDKYEPLEIKKE